MLLVRAPHACRHLGARALSTSARGPAGLTYCFGGVVYVGLTNELNAGLSMLAANGPGFGFPPGTGFAPLPDGFAPTGAEAAAAALEACRQLNAQQQREPEPRAVVFAGLGEPLLRLPALCEALALLRDAREAEPALLAAGALRLNTNGMLPAELLRGGEGEGGCERAAAALAENGLSRCCVQLQSADAAQHRLLMGLGGAASGAGAEAEEQAAARPGLEDAKALVRALLACGVQVDCSVVARPAVDVARAAALAAELGAGFIERPWFP